MYGTINSTRQPGNPATRQPGNPATRQPGNPATRQNLYSHESLQKICLILLVAVMAYACIKPDPMVSEVPLTFRTQYFSNPPIAEDDRLFFEDFDQFEEYYLELDDLFESNEDLFDSIVHTTSAVETVNDLITTDSFANPQAAYQTFLTDPIMRAIVNPYYELQIGDVMITYINNSEILVSDASNSSLRTSIRAIPKGEPLDINDIPNGAFWSDDRDIEDAIEILCATSISIRPFDCGTLRVFGRCTNVLGGAGDGTVTITYDQDGPPINPITIVTENVSGNFEFFIDIGFRQTGYIEAQVDPVCVFGNTQTASFFYNSSTYAACDEGERSIKYDVTQGNEMMTVETSFYVTFTGEYHKAEMWARTWNGSGWPQTRAKLDVRVDANRKSVVCQLLDSKDDEKDCNNCRHRAVRVSWTNPVAHCDGDLIGTYSKIKSGITLDDEQEVDFICCD